MKYSMILGIVALGTVVMGCDKVQETAPERRGDRGESCRARNDCKSGLACVREVCVVNEFTIEPAARHCELIECNSDDDCCEAPMEDPAQCSAWERDCLAGEEYYCYDFLSSCACSYTCTDNQCLFVQPCFTDDHCGFNGECRDRVCVIACEEDNECYDGQMCIDGDCIEACEGNSDCPFFHRCEEHVCEEHGCETDRECAAYTRHPLAECEDRECSIPCENDAECNNGEYEFFACVRDLCVYVGCETDEECRIYLEVWPGSGMEAVCIDDED